MEPLAVLGTAYSAYYLAEVFHWSGIISLIGCGITQVQNRVKPDIYVSLTAHKLMYFSKGLIKHTRCATVKEHLCGFSHNGGDVRQVAELYLDN